MASADSEVVRTRMPEPFVELLLTFHHPQVIMSNVKLGKHASQNSCKVRRVPSSSYFAQRADTTPHPPHLRHPFPLASAPSHLHLRR